MHLVKSIWSAIWIQTCDPLVASPIDYIKSFLISILKRFPCPTPMLTVKTFLSVSLITPNTLAQAWNSRASWSVFWLISVISCRSSSPPTSLTVTWWWRWPRSLPTTPSTCSHASCTWAPAWDGTSPASPCLESWCSLAPQAATSPCWASAISSCQACCCASCSDTTTIRNRPMEKFPVLSTCPAGCSGFPTSTAPWLVTLLVRIATV